METIFFAPSIVLNALSSFYAVVKQYTHPSSVSPRTQNATNPHTTRAPRRVVAAAVARSRLYPNSTRAVRARPHRTNAPPRSARSTRARHTHTYLCVIKLLLILHLEQRIPRRGFKQQQHRCAQTISMHSSRGKLARVTSTMTRGRCDANDDDDERCVVSRTARCERRLAMDERVDGGEL